MFRNELIEAIKESNQGITFWLDQDVLPNQVWLFWQRKIIDWIENDNNWFAKTNELEKFDPNSLPLSSEQIPYKLQEDKFIEQERTNIKLKKKIRKQDEEIILFRKFHESNDGYSFPIFERRYKAAKTILFWYRQARDENEALKEIDKIKSRKDSLLATKIDYRRKFRY